MAKKGYQSRNPVEHATRDVEFEEMFEEAAFADRARRDEEWAENVRQHGGDPAVREKIRVSEVGYATGDAACERRFWYDFHNAPKDSLTMEQLVNMGVSSLAGYWAANTLARSGRVHKVEFKMDFDPFPVSGRLDILCDPETRRVIECKAVTTEQFGHLPKQEHFDQPMLYVWSVRRATVLGQLEPEFIKYTPSVFYIGRNARKGQPTHEAYVVPYSEERALWLLQELTRVRNVAVNAPTPPDRPKGFSRSDFPCAYCPFKLHCWSGQENLPLGKPV
jgi:hypothetical protein